MFLSPRCIAFSKDGSADSSYSSRPSFEETDYASVGDETHKQIYRGVGNPEVASMVAEYLPELCTWHSKESIGEDVIDQRTCSIRREDCYFRLRYWRM